MTTNLAYETKLGFDPMFQAINADKSIHGQISTKYSSN